MRRRSVNRAGLTALLPIASDKAEEALGALVERLPGGEQSPFARLECTHFARLLVVPARAEADNLPACLLFASEFDISPAGYLDLLCERMPAEAESIFRHCSGYPGVSAPRYFQRWIFDHRVRAGFSVHGNEHATVDRIRHSLALREQLIAFAMKTRDDDPATLLQRWQAEGWSAPPAPARAYDGEALVAGRRPTRSGGATPVRQDDLQGNILCGYGYKYGHGAYLFATADDPATARAWIGAQAARVTTARPWSMPPRDTLNLAFTHTGLRRLEVDEAILRLFPDEFKAGMAARAAKLGDTGPSEPKEWQVGLAGAHVLVTVMARSAAARDTRVPELALELLDAGFSVDAVQMTAFGADGDEPFGFRDGISQPPIRDPKAGRTRRDGDGAPVHPGEFVLGYEDEGGCLAVGPGEFGRNGSYLVVRKLAQDVDGFWSFMREQAGPDRGRQEWLASKIVGRWPDGTPMALSPDLPGGTRDREAQNNFGYADDARGLRCPVGAHIRRTNPRDALDPHGRLSRRHRIIRRGMPLEDEDGLMFACYQASIERQFEFVQELWCGDGSAFGLGDDADFLVGPEEGKMTVQGNPPTLLPLKRFVTMRGGDYFFAPGIATLHTIGLGPEGSRG